MSAVGRERPAAARPLDADEPHRQPGRDRRVCGLTVSICPPTSVRTAERGKRSPVVRRPLALRALDPLLLPDDR